MAEAIGIASGLLALSTFALKSTLALYETVKSFQAHGKQVRDLGEELKALSTVLQTLTDTLDASPDADVSALGLPLRRCGMACKEFEAELIKCTSRSGVDRTSFRDWARLRYMGGDVRNFKDSLAGYKSTIAIALNDLNLRQSNATAETIERQRQLIEMATADLEGRLDEIDTKLQDIIEATSGSSDVDVGEMRLMKEERLSTQKCLQVCSQVLRHIDQLEIPFRRKSEASHLQDVVGFPETVTNQSLRECVTSLSSTTERLEGHMQDIVSRMLRQSRTTPTPDDDRTELARFQEEWNTIRQCRTICSQAGRSLQDKVSDIDNYATGHAVQIMVSTEGLIIHGRNRGLGQTTRQVGGHMSDASLQQISRDMASVRFQGYDDVGLNTTSAGVDNESIVNAIERTRLHSDSGLDPPSVLRQKKDVLEVDHAQRDESRAPNEGRPRK